MKNEKPPVGQASRLSEHSWRRHLPHFQLSAGYYFITFTTHNRQILQQSHKDCVLEAIRFLDGKKYELYAVVIQIKANLAEEYEDYKWLYIKGWINDYS